MIVRDIRPISGGIHAMSGGIRPISGDIRPISGKWLRLDGVLEPQDIHEQPRDLRPISVFTSQLSSEHGTRKTVTASFRPSFLSTKALYISFI